jgi:hypothetical protein
MQSKTTYKGQLRIFPDEEKYFLTEPSEGLEQQSIFLLRHYLDAIKYLPQDAIRQMAPADRYIISQREEGTPGSYDRVITYTQNGVEDIDGWYIHLEIQPLHTDGDAFSGTGDEVIHVFYSGNGFDGDRSQLDQLQADRILVSRMDFPSGTKFDVTITDQKIIAQLLAMYKSVEVEDYSRPLNDERVMLQFFSGDNMILDWYVSFYKEDNEVVTCGDAFGLGNKRVVGAFDYKRFLDLFENVGIMMIPTNTALVGCPSGALLVPIDGNVYRYELSESNPEGLTVDELLYTFTEETHIEGIVWEVYSLKEYPDKTAVLMLSGTNIAWLCRYSPPGRCADNALSEAIVAGNVVMEDGIGTSGQDIWKEFYERTQQGKPASVTVAHYYTLDPETCDSAYYETYKQDYPCLYEIHLDFDGKTFTLTEPDGNDVRIRTFEHLMKYDNTEFYPQSSKIPGRRFDYVLTHDNTVTWEKLFNGLVSSQMGAYIDHYSIYSERVH